MPDQPSSRIGSTRTPYPAWYAVSARYPTLSRSSPLTSVSHQAKCTRSPASRGRAARQASTSRSCRLFHWSAAGRVSRSQYHCTIAASTSEVGVSALYSNSFAGPVPS